jgi:hypothetical protein
LMSSLSCVPPPARHTKGTGTGRDSDTNMRRQQRWRRRQHTSDIDIGSDGVDENDINSEGCHTCQCELTEFPDVRNVLRRRRRVAATTVRVVQRHGRLGNLLPVHRMRGQHHARADTCTGVTLLHHSQAYTRAHPPASPPPHPSDALPRCLALAHSRQCGGTKWQRSSVQP